MFSVTLEWFTLWWLVGFGPIDAFVSAFPAKLTFTLVVERFTEGAIKLSQLRYEIYIRLLWNNLCVCGFCYLLAMNGGWFDNKAAAYWFCASTLLFFVGPSLL